MGANFLTLALALARLLGPPALAQETAESWDARLSEVKGQVTAYTPEDPEGAPAEKEAPLDAGDRIVTGSDGSAEISFDGQHVVSLKANSDFTIAASPKAATELRLLAGSLLAKLQSMLASHTLRVRTPTAVLAVRGTELGVEVSADDSGSTYVGVFDEGEVEVSGETGPAELLKANQETRVLRGARPLPAYQLQRLMRHRAFMRDTLRRRAQLARRAWRAMPPEQRRELRRRVLERMGQRRRERLEKLQGHKKGPSRLGPPKRLRPDQEKMQRRKEEIRRRRQRQ